MDMDVNIEYGYDGYVVYIVYIYIYCTCLMVQNIPAIVILDEASWL